MRLRVVWVHCFDLLPCSDWCTKVRVDQSHCFDIPIGARDYDSIGRGSVHETTS